MNLYTSTRIASLALMVPVALFALFALFQFLSYPEAEMLMVIVGAFGGIVALAIPACIAQIGIDLNQCQNAEVK